MSGKTAKHPLGTYDTLDYDTATHSSSIIALISENYLICLSVCLSVYLPYIWSWKQCALQVITNYGIEYDGFEH